MIRAYDFVFASAFLILFVYDRSVRSYETRGRKDTKELTVLNPFPLFSMSACLLSHQGHSLAPKNV
jgi:hypothetical protein